MKKTTIQYNNANLDVDLNTGKVTQNGLDCYVYLNKHLGRKYVCYVDNDGNRKRALYARVICLAAHPNKNYKFLQADHIDSNTLNDSPENLQWLTCKQNNSKEHAIMMKKINHKATRHDGQYVKATLKDDNNIVMWFKNGRTAAKAIGVSHVAAYKVLNPDHYSKTCRGWILQYVNIKEVPESIIWKDAEEKHKKKENNMKTSTAKKQLAAAAQKVETWKRHLAKVQNDISSKLKQAQMKVKKAEEEQKAAQLLVDALEAVEDVASSTKEE